MKKQIVAVMVFCGFAALVFSGTAMNDWLSPRMSNDEVVTTINNLRPYQVDEASASTTYLRYESGTGTVLIVKYSVSGTVTTCEKAYATWANRATATYAAINN